MAILIISAFLICLLYLVFKPALDKRPPVFTLAAIAFFVAVTATAAGTHASLSGSYGGQQVWIQERAFFFEVFADELTKTGDLRKAAKHMQTPEVKERTRACVRQIVDSFRPTTVCCLSVGGLILLLAAGSLWIKSLSGKEYFPYLLVVFVLVGGIVFDIGIWHRRYASGLDVRLQNFLRRQQALMEKVAEMKTDLTIPEIAAVARQEAEASGYGSGGALLEEALKKQPAGGK